ncbi:MAG: zinc ribbon domain-containing protein [Gemmatimonadales bacterium]
MSSSNHVLERFHQTLLEEIQTHRPEYLTGPFTVAEIYQNLVPYGSHRDRIGVSMNGDYEDALLRLLAGEGGFLILDSEPALRDLREELRTPNPNTGLYREYAAVDVRLNQSFVDLSVLGMDLGGSAPTTDEVPQPTASGGDMGIVPAGVDVFEGEGDAAAPAGHACPWCRAELPARANLNFCPFCGTDLKVVPCGKCGEELEPSWRFCIACGTEVSG